MLRVAFEGAILAAFREGDAHAMGRIVHDWPLVCKSWRWALIETLETPNEVKAMWRRIARATAFPLCRQWGAPCAHVQEAIASWHKQPDELLREMQYLARGANRQNPPRSFDCMPTQEFEKRIDDETLSDYAALDAGYRNHRALLVMIMRVFAVRYAWDIYRRVGVAVLPGFAAKYRHRLSRPHHTPNPDGRSYRVSLEHGTDRLHAELDELFENVDRDGFSAHRTKFLELGRALVAPSPASVPVTLEYTTKTVSLHLGTDAAVVESLQHPKRLQGRTLDQLVDRLLHYKDKMRLIVQRT